jgi:hypothetical protein
MIEGPLEPRLYPVISGPASKPGWATGNLVDKAEAGYCLHTRNGPFFLRASAILLLILLASPGMDTATNGLAIGR